MARISRLSFGECVAVAALLVVAVAASAQTRNRITQGMETGERAVVAGAHPLARAKFDRGPVADGMRIDHAAMVFKPSPEQQQALEKLLAEQQDPASPNYHKWLDPEQYGQRFGMSEDDLAKVSNWLKSQGLTVGGYARGRNRIFFSGTAAQVASAFRTEFHQYAVDGETRFANATGISVPAALSGIVIDFRGFDSFRPRPRVHPVKSNFTSHVTGNHFVAPVDFAVIYNLKPLYDAGFDGTGESIAVVGQTEIHRTDITSFRSAAGLPPANLQLIPIDSTQTGFKSKDEVEADLDIEWSGAVAKNATILYVFTGANSTTKNVFDAFSFAIDNKLGSVISTSYGNCEAILGTFVQTLRQDAQRANTQGQTITAASGDSGAADCDLPSANSAVKGLAVDSPASVPEVTGIGGSEFTGDLAGTVTGTAPNTDASGTTFWAGTTGAKDTINSALSYIPEMAWNDTVASVAAGKGLSASGGGVSTVFSKPAWQSLNNITPADGQRDVPDASLTASPNHDSMLICSQASFGATPANPTSCSAGFRASDGSFGAVGGTSVGAPAFSGIVAIINQATQSSSGNGPINPILYDRTKIPAAAFHDITTGDNKVPCTAGSTGCPASHVIGFSAGPGYDLVTGLGSINADVLVRSWPNFVATADFSVGGTPVSIPAPGQPGTSTVTVTATNGFNGTVNLACALTPASTTVGVTCAFLPPASVSVNGSSQTATLTISTVPPHVLSGTSASLQRPRGFGWVAASGSALLAGVFLLGIPLRWRRRGAGLGVMLVVFLAAGMGCGGGSSTPPPKTGGTPVGNYTIAVTATSGALTHNTNLAVTVQ
jgi:subtilase family serine protease